jgi:hypothetical protein
VTTSIIVPSTSWAERSAEIKLTFGEFFLGTAEFRAAVYKDADWRSSEAVAVDDIRERLKSGVEVVCLYSQPMTKIPSRLSFRKFGIRYVPTRFSRHCIEIQGAFVDYLKRFNSRERNNLTRRVRRFTELNGGKALFCEYREAPEIVKFYDLASNITRKTYQHRLLHASMGQTAEFREKFLALAGRGQLRAFILFYNDVPVAFQYSTICGDMLTGQITGYDPDYRQHSPGIVLHYYILERLFSEGRVRLFDFGAGDADYKAFFATNSVKCETVYYFAYSLKNVGFLLLHVGLRLLSKVTVNFLSVFGLKGAIKRVIRRF